MYVQCILFEGCFIGIIANKSIEGVKPRLGIQSRDLHVGNLQVLDVVYETFRGGAICGGGGWLSCYW